MLSLLSGAPGTVVPLVFFVLVLLIFVAGVKLDLRAERRRGRSWPDGPRAPGADDGP